MMGVTKYLGNTGSKLLSRWRLQSEPNKQPWLVRWMDSFSDEQWLEFVLYEIRHRIARGAHCVVLLGSGKLSVKIQTRLMTNVLGENVRRILVFDLNGQDTSQEPIPDSRISKIESLGDIDVPAQSVVFVSCFTDNAAAQKSLQLVLSHPEFRYSEFVFKIRASDSYPALTNYDSYVNTLFLSPVFEDSVINDVYEFALTKVEPKCKVRDAYDLYQLLLQTREVEGAVAEFGSYKGHSGLIITEVMKRLDIRKQIYLCDTFLEFPTENISVDKFWNYPVSSHLVEYEEVKRLFENYRYVHLIRGDFADTIDSIPEDCFSFVYVDCDSYRAVKLVSERIYPKLSHGAVIAYEDYGHDFCLGARHAVDEFYEERRDCFRFFSGFSGFYVVVKL